MSYSFHPAAESEYLEAIAYYESKRSGLGAGFLVELETAIGAVLVAPHRNPVEKPPDVRRKRLKQFPYTVLYRDAGAGVLARAREVIEQFEESEQPVLIDTAGWVQYRSGNYGRSVELLEKAAELGLEAPEHEYHLGMAYLKVGRIDEGRALLARAIDSGTDFPGIEEARAAREESR